MKIKIAVFGREELLQHFNDFVKGNNDFQIIPFPYKKAEECVQLIEKSFMCDVNLFLEPLPYLYTKDKIKKKRLPVVQVPFDEYMILSNFYHVKNHYNHTLNRLSIDVLEEDSIQEVLTDLNLENQDIYSYSYGRDEKVNINHIVEYHKQLWDEGKIDYVLTSLWEVDSKLQKLKIPSYCMVTPKVNIIKAMERIRSMIQLNKSKSSQIVAGFIHIKKWEDLVLEKGQAHAKELQSKLKQILLKFGEKTFATVFHNNQNHYIIIGTRGVLDHITNHYRDFPLLQDIEKSLNTPVNIGFGLGLTAKQAEEHAKLALEACNHSFNSTCYIVNDRGETIGPLGVKKQFDTSRLYQALIHKARLNNELSYNFIDFVKLRNNEPFSSHDIANYYQVTKRSAERTVNKLLAGEVIKVVGEEKPYVKGRPRKLFQINV